MRVMPDTGAGSGTRGGAGDGLGASERRLRAVLPINGLSAACLAAASCASLTES